MEFYINVKLTKEELQAYEDLKDFLAFQLPDSLDNFAVDAKSKFAKLQTLTSGFVYDEQHNTTRVGTSKLDAALDFVLRANANNENVLVFLNFKETANRLAEMLTANKVNFATLKDVANIDRWNAGELQCLIANPASAGHGLNLQHGGHVVLWLELTYNFEFWQQGNARLHRTGQQQPVRAYYLLADNTMDQHIIKLLQKKMLTNKKSLNILK